MDFFPRRLGYGKRDVKTLFIEGKSIIPKETPRVYSIYMPIQQNARGDSHIHAAAATPSKLINSTCAPNCKLHKPIFFIRRRRVS